MGISLASASRGLLPPPRSPSSTSSGAHALICCRGHSPLEVCSLPHALSHLPAVVLMCSSAVVGIVLSWSAFSHTLSHLPAVCSCAHLLSWASSSRDLLPLTHRLSHLPAVGLMRSSAVVGILLSWSAPSPHTLSHLPAVGLMRPSAVEDIVLSWSAPSQTLSSTRSGALPSGGESSVSLALPRARE